MSIYKIGYIIKQRREELHYTQEELAEGICSVTTLSRIENGERLPSKDNFEMLFQRLGISDTILFESVDENTLYLHELKFKIRQAVINYRYAEAQELIGDYAAKTDMASPVERQFVLINSTLANKKDYSPEERLSRFEEALRLTCPKYTEGYIPRLLTYEEIIILNNIALHHNHKQEYKEAIRILYALKLHYDNNAVNKEENLRTQPMVLYNLSKCLGLNGQYSECIEICDLGIRIARDTGRCGVLPGTLYNRAWSLSKRMQPGDMEQALETLKQALCAAVAMGDSFALKHFLNFARQTFPESDLLKFF
ncbi:MAG: helix-turn-helix transcriptional regulator [Clostridia bacterium]|nr:helix-turn-helix transcriptional regulator [Clostridia bacterium]